MGRGLAQKLPIRNFIKTEWGYLYQNTMLIIIMILIIIIITVPTIILIVKTIIMTVMLKGNTSNESMSVSSLNLSPQWSQRRPDPHAN